MDFLKQIEECMHYKLSDNKDLSNKNKIENNVNYQLIDSIVSGQVVSESNRVLHKNSLIREEIRKAQEEGNKEEEDKATSELEKPVTIEKFMIPSDTSKYQIPNYPIFPLKIFKSWYK